MGDTGDRGSAGSGGGAVGGHLHWPHTGVCGVSPYLRIVCKREYLLWGGGAQEVPMVVAGGAKKSAQGKLGGYLMGGQCKAEKGDTQ